MFAAEPGLARRRLCNALLVLAFFLLCGFDLWHHQMWRDEMQPWLFARDSATIPALFRNMRYEIHPRLWYLILFGVTRITHNPEAMQVTHLLIIGSAMTLFVYFCPMPFHIKALTVFGYFFVWEWGTISRNYALGVLFCFAFCAMFPRRDKGWLGLAAILFLATQSNHYAALLAAALCGLLILEASTTPEARARVRARKADAALSLFLVYGGVLLTFLMGIPRPDVTRSNLSFGSDWDGTIVPAFTAFWDGFLPLANPAFSYYFRGGIIGFFALPALQPIFGMILFLLTVAFFWRWRLIFWAYLGGAGMLLLLSYVNAHNDPRHAGHFFLWFLICLWLTYYFPDSRAVRNTGPLKLSLFQRLAVCSLLLVQIWNYAIIRAWSYQSPFSCSKAVALYIEQHDLKKLPIIGYPDYVAMPVSGYLDVPIYYINADRWGSFIIENNKRRFNLTTQEILQCVDKFAGQGNRDFLLLLNRPIPALRGTVLFEPKQIGNLHEEASFYPAAVSEEDYWLYRYKAVSSGG